MSANSSAVTKRRSAGVEDSATLGCTIEADGSDDPGGVGRYFVEKIEYQGAHMVSRYAESAAGRFLLLMRLDFNNVGTEMPMEDHRSSCPGTYFAEWRAAWPSPGLCDRNLRVYDVGEPRST